LTSPPLRTADITLFIDSEIVGYAGVAGRGTATPLSSCST
jgi:hypothetical protein